MSTKIGSSVVSKVRSIHLIPVVAVLLIAGCASPHRANAVPQGLEDRAVIPGMTKAVRSWAAKLTPEMEADVIESIHREQTWRASQGETGPLPVAEYLALSGGGSDGAFGAGILCGWTAAGNRPTFKLVTGISTGALIAPFAFAGPKYDPVLKDVYTRTRTKDLLEERFILSALYNDALTDNSPMWRKLEGLVNEELLKDIAAEYRKGRLLIIGTTNLDARRAVLWNVGAIADSGNPQALHLLRSIMIASASIPAAFPPVMFDVEVDGVKYAEMHVDGGAMTQVFIAPPTLRVADVARAAGIERQRRAYVIRNSRLDPQWAQTDRRTLTIAGRAISSLIFSQGFGDLVRIYANCQRDGIEFNLAFIPSTFTVESKEAFDTEYMTKLFNVGYDLSKTGYPWAKTPPLFGEPAK